MRGLRKQTAHDSRVRHATRVALDRLQMSNERIDLYVGLLDAVDKPHVREICLATLSLQERRCAERFVFDRHRNHYIIAHGLLRVALSKFVPDVKPQDWSFVTNQYGRPFVVAPAIAQSVYFSLSHTDGCVACVVSGCEPVGVDVEEICERQSLWATAHSNFSSEEIDTLRALKPAEAIDRFFDYWTLKEAYVKARSTGINLPLNRFSIVGLSEHKIGIQFASEIADDPKRWHFMKCSPSARHRLAIADGSGMGATIVAQCWPFA